MTGTLTSRATAVYLYAVCRDDVPAPAPGEASGHHGGGPVRTLPAGPLTALVQDVPAAEFTEEALRERLTDRGELERCARTHHEVVARAAGHTDVLPLPLATLYRPEANLLDTLRTDAARFGAALARIAGREEWGVKVYAAPKPTASSAPGPAPAPEPPTVPAAPAAATSGRAYLDRVRGRNRAREERADTALRCGERIEEALRGTAVAVRRLRTHGPETTGGRRPQLLNAACLLPRGEDAALSDAVARLRAAEAVDIEVTGPWVPYSFVDPGSVQRGGGHDA
jgi:hypothetical protein